MNLTLRYDPAEQCLRSTGDELPGVIGVAQPDGEFSLIVDRLVEPALIPAGTVPITNPENGIGPTQVPIELDDAVAGCADEDALRVLYAVVAKMLAAGCALFVEAQEFESLHKLVSFTEDVAQAVESRLVE